MTRATYPKTADRAVHRLLVALAEPGITAMLREGDIILQSSGKVSLARASFKGELADALVSRGAAEWRSAANRRLLLLTDAGRALLLRLKAGENPFLAQHRDIEPTPFKQDGETVTAAVNLKENPLLWLHRRKGRNAEALIDDAQFAAGERFRADFERAGMVQRTTIDWSRLGAATDGGRGSEPSDSMLAARSRINKALDAVGQELSGPILDLICFGKGLEQIEQDRHWPARSGKLVIRLGLSALARHYGYSAFAHGAKNQRGIGRWVASTGSDGACLAPDPVHQ